MSTSINVRPGRYKITLWVRSLANLVRTYIKIDIFNAWIQRRGFLRVPFSVSLWSPNKHIIFGHKVQFGSNCMVHCDAEFGSNVLVACNVAFVGRDDHRHDLVGVRIWDAPRGDRFKVVVEDDVWIGHGVVVLSGVTIGNGSVVAAGSVVIDDVPSYSIVAGNPARLLRTRFTNDQILLHEKKLSESYS